MLDQILTKFAAVQKVHRKVDGFYDFLKRPFTLQLYAYTCLIELGEKYNNDELLGDFMLASFTERSIWDRLVGLYALWMSLNWKYRIRGKEMRGQMMNFE